MKWDSPEFDKARTPEELATSFDHQGYADGDAGYLGRNVSYAEADMIKDALRGFAEARSAAASHLAALGVLAEVRDRLAAQVAALRHALMVVRSDIEHGHEARAPLLVIDHALADTAASAQAHDERIRAEEREAIIALIEGGRFLHDDSPPARFAREVVAMIRRERT